MVGYSLIDKENLKLTLTVKLIKMLHHIIWVLILCCSVAEVLSSGLCICVPVSNSFQFLWEKLSWNRSAFSLTTAKIYFFLGFNVSYQSRTNKMYQDGKMWFASEIRWECHDSVIDVIFAVILKILSDVDKLWVAEKDCFTCSAGELLNIWVD